jgi:hypothetical protein
MSYQIAYCDSKFWKSGPLKDQVEQTFRWYLLECPIIGIATVGKAKEMAMRKIKARFGPRAQVVIFGLEKGQHVRMDADSILGITVLQGANATECEAPKIVFGRGKKAVFYSRPEDLKIGKPW